MNTNLLTELTVALLLAAIQFPDGSTATFQCCTSANITTISKRKYARTYLQFIYKVPHLQVASFTCPHRVPSGSERYSMQLLSI